ncbi:MAG: flagella basal body P-ring formation protein FlgA [Terriglobia bacterium]
MIPHRGPGLLSRREIFQAIQNDLAQKGISGRGKLRPEDLRIQVSVPVLQHEMGLQVRKIGFDPIRRETVFELWASREPQYLPFEVTTRRDPQSLGLASGLARMTVDAGEGYPAESPAAWQGENRARSKPPVLAKPGRPATLIMLGQNIRITTTVVPLQPGSKGQHILVRDLATARVMTAEVVDEGLLQTSF